MGSQSASINVNLIFLDDTIFSVSQNAEHTRDLKCRSQRRPRIIVKMDDVDYFRMCNAERFCSNLNAIRSLAVLDVGFLCGLARATIGKQKEIPDVPLQPGFKSNKRTAAKQENPYCGTPHLD